MKRFMRRLAGWIDKWVVGDALPDSTAMLLPLLIMGAMLAAKLLSKHGQNKQASEQYNAAKTAWDAGQARRSTKIGAVNSFLSGLNANHTLDSGATHNPVDVAGKLPPSAPNYSFDPTTLTGLQKATPYAGGDPGKGAGWDMAGTALGGVANIAAQAYTGGLLGGSGGSSSLGAPIAGQSLQFPSMTQDNPFGVRG